MLDALGTGLYIGNLWYLNYSDHPNGRVTGMTRFSTLWVEGGRAVAPAEVMRFDDTLFHLLGLDPHQLEVPGHKRLEEDFGEVMHGILA